MCVGMDARSLYVGTPLMEESGTIAFLLLPLLPLTTLCDMIYRHLAAGMLDKLKI